MNFIAPVLLDKGMTKSLWNEGACFGTELYLDFGGSVPKLLLTLKGKTDVIRVIPYHNIRDFDTYDTLGLPSDDD